MISNNRILTFAIVFGLGAHAALLASIHKIPIGQYRARLSTPADILAKQMKSVRVERSKDDLVLSGKDSPFEDRTGAGKTSRDKGQVLPEQVQNLLEHLRVDTSSLPKAPDPTEELSNPVEKPGVKKLTGSKPNVNTPAPSPKMTREILAMTRPNLQLPTFKGNTDTIAVPLPGTIFFRPGGKIKTAGIKDINKVIGSGVPGVGTGVPKPGVGTKPGEKKMVKEKPEAIKKIIEKPLVVKPVMKKPADVVKNIVKPEMKKPLPVLPKIVTQLPKINPIGNRPADIHLDEDFTYSLQKYRGPVNVGGFFSKPTVEKEGWFEVRIAPNQTLRKLTPLKKDVVYVIDTSASISEKWLRATRKGLGVALDNLHEGDRFNIMLFKETVSLFSATELTVKATAESKARARKFLETASTSGWTDVNQALSRLIVHQTAPDRVYQIVLLTDGVPTRGALDPRRIINMITRENGRVAGIFCVGIGERIDRELLDFLAYRNKGMVVYPKSALAVAGEIRELTGRIQYPLVKDAKFNLVGVDRDSVYPQIHRDIYLGDTLSYFGRYDNERQISMRLTGTNSNQYLDLTFTLPFIAAQMGNEGTAKKWAFWKLHHLYSEIARQGKTPKLMSEINKIKKAYGIKAAY